MAPASIAAAQTRATKSGSERVASSQENSTSSAQRRGVGDRVARPRRAPRRASCPSLRSMWIGLVAMKTWIRERRASASASAAASRSARFVRASAATTGPLRRPAATARTPSKSPGRGDREARPRRRRRRAARAARRSRPSRPAAARCPATARRPAMSCRRSAILLKALVLLRVPPGDALLVWKGRRVRREARGPKAPLDGENRGQRRGVLRGRATTAGRVLRWQRSGPSRC